VFDIELLEIIAGEPPLAAPEDVAAAPAHATKTRSGLAYTFLSRNEQAKTERAKTERAKTERATNEEHRDSRPNAWDRVTIRVAGWTTEGSALAGFGPRERASTFDLAKVMPGWRETLQLIAIGDRVRVWIPEALAYQGAVGKPKGTVVFDIELVSIERMPEPPRAPASAAAPPRNATKTKSGLAYRVLHKGTGSGKPSPNDRVEVHYSAWTRDGDLLDSSRVRGKPSTIPVSRVIPGWAEGLQLMSEGDKALFWIPEKLAYAGKAGSPRGPLLYEVELLSIASER
jgi:peptidylprolyl isomerase